MTETALAPVAAPIDLALLKAVGLDRLAPEQRQLAISIATRYELDLLLKHLVMIEGRPYITRDGLLHVAHRSGQLDGIETTEPMVVDGFWRSTCSVYRKDMSRPFTYGGRYPTSGGNQKFAPEMAVKVAEVQALRRAFDVSAPTVEERWDLEAPEAAAEPARRPSLAERVAEKAAEVVVEDAPRAPETAQNGPDPDEGVWEAAKAAVTAEPGMTLAEFNTARKDAFIPPTRIKDAGERLFPGQRLSDLSDRDRLALWLEVQG